MPKGKSPLKSSIIGNRGKKIQEYLFFAAIILLPFQMIPQPIALQLHFPLLAFPHATAYPVAIGLFIQVSEIIKERTWNRHIPIACYFIILSLWVLFSASMGIIRLSPGVHYSDTIYAVTKFGIGPFIVTNGTAVWIYLLFRERWFRGLLLLRRGLLISFLIAGAYSVIEVLFLLGSVYAKTALTLINPLIYTAKTHHNWWPPLLWYGQVRSVAPEPSFFGVYTAVVLPFLFSYLMENKRILVKYWVINCWLFVLVFMTKSRTALLLFIGEAVILALNILSTKKANLVKKIGIVFCILSSIIILTNYSFMQDKRERSEVSSQSVTNIIFSLGKLNERSNTARYAIQVAEFNMGIEHLVCGVGSGLGSFYFEKYVPHFAAESGEVKNWIKYQHENNMAYRSIPIVNVYTNKFAEWGLSGIILFSAPILGIFVASIKKIRLQNGNRRKILSTLYFTAFVGSCAGLLSTSEITVLSFDILLGLGLCLLDQYFKPYMALSKKEINKYNDKQTSTIA